MERLENISRFNIPLALRCKGWKRQRECAKDSTNKQIYYFQLKKKFSFKDI